VTEQVRESDESDPTLADDAPPRADDREVEDKSADNWGGNEPGWWSTEIELEERESETHAASVAGSSDSDADSDDGFVSADDSGFVDPDTDDGFVSADDSGFVDPDSDDGFVSADDSGFVDPDSDDEDDSLDDSDEEDVPEGRRRRLMALWRSGAQGRAPAHPDADSCLQWEWGEWQAWWRSHQPTWDEIRAYHRRREIEEDKREHPSE
jgi:hypothetical protein